MLPDKMLRQLDRDVELHFGQSHPGLFDAARKLADAGWPWEEIRELLSQVHRAGVQYAVDEFHH
jgi:hypothetical protein